MHSQCSLQPLALLHNRYLWSPSSECHPNLSDDENDGYNSKWSVAIHLTQLMSTDWAILGVIMSRKELMAAAAPLPLLLLQNLLKENTGFHPQAVAKKAQQAKQNPKVSANSRSAERSHCTLSVHVSSLEMQQLESSKHLPANIYQHGRCLRDTLHSTFNF